MARINDDMTLFIFKIELILLDQVALMKFIYPRLRIASGSVGIYLKILGQNCDNIGKFELLALQLLPKQLRGGIECNYSSHICAKATLLDDNVLAGNLSNFVSLFEFHAAKIVKGVGK